MNTTTSDMLGLGKTQQKTSSSWFSASGGNNNNNNAQDPLQDLSADQLRERLMVAETIMKQ